MEDPCASSGIICSQPSLDTANPVVTGIVFENKGLAGPIPPQLGALTNLNKLGLASNKLEGPIPGELGNLKSLEQLKLNENSGLVGAIPLELGNLEALKVLMLDDNSHDGQIPRSFGRLSELVEFSLAGNKLTGTCSPSRAPPPVANPSPPYRPDSGGAGRAGQGGRALPARQRPDWKSPCGPRRPLGPEHVVPEGQQPYRLPAV